MSQTETIQTPEDYVNYTFNIESRGIAEVSSELMGLSNTVGNILGQLAFKTSEFLNHTDMLAIGTGAAISAMFVSASRDAIHFQQQIANVQAIGGEAINAQSIGDAAMEYSNKFGMATAQMTEGLEALARAGITSTNVMKEVLAEGVKLSKLEGLDLEDSINDLISTTNLLSEAGVDMNDANYGQLVQEMNQHIVSTSESAPINAQNIIQTLQHVGGYASASGMDQDDLFAVIAQLGSRGTKGEMAGTALRAFIAAGQKDTAQRALARIGLNVTDLWSENGETMLPISEMKNVLDEALEARGYSRQEKLEFYSDFAGYKQANQIMKIDTSEVQKYKEDIANAWDLGKKLDVILGTVRGNLDRIWQITQNFMTKVGSKLLTVAGAILAPIRTLLEVFTSLPFADTAVAAGMIFVAFRTGLMIFNKLVPAIVGFMSGITSVSKESTNIRNIWRDTNTELKTAKEVFSMIKEGNKEGLVNKAFDEHELIGRHRDELEDMLAAQHYMKSPLYDQLSRTPWQDLPTFQRYLIKLNLKGNEDFQENYKNTLETAKENAKVVGESKLNLSNPKDKEGLEAVNVWLKNIYDLLKSERTRGEDDSPLNNRDSNKQANYISKIMSQYNITPGRYGNYDFKYENEEDISKLKDATNATIRKIEKQVKEFDNIDFSKINNTQRELYRKQLFKTSEENQARKDYSLDSHESEVRFALEHGRVTDASKWYSDTYKQQLAQMAHALGISTVGMENATTEQLDNLVKDISDTIKTVDNSKEKINEIANITRQSWDTHLDTTNFSFLRRNQEMAQDIASVLSIDTNQHNTVADAVINFFNQEANRTDSNFNKAIEIMFNYSHSGDGMGSLEQESLRFTLDKLQRERNTFQSFINQDMFNESRDEMSRIIEQLDANNVIFREGGARLGQALVKGFVEDGLGIHSPGDIYKAMYGELDAIKILLSEFNISDYANDILSNFDPKNFAADSQKYTSRPGALQRADMAAQNAMNWSFDDVILPLSDYVFPYGSDLNRRARGYTPWARKKHRMRWVENRLSEDYEGNSFDAYRKFIDDTNDILNYAIQTKTIPLSSNSVLHRGGYIPKTNDNGIAFFDSITSTTYNKKIGEHYAEKHGGLLNIYSPRNIKGFLAGGKVLRNNDLYLDEQERTLGYGQPVIQIGDIFDYKTKRGEVVEAANMLALSPEHILGIKAAVESEVSDVNDILREKVPTLQESSFLLANKMTKSFIEDGLGRHSPGDWYKAVDDETIDVMDLIDNRSDKIGDMIRSFLGDNRALLINQLKTADGLITGLGEKKVRIQGQDGKNRFQSYDNVIDDLMMQAIFNLEERWKGNRFTAGDILFGNAPEGADFKDAIKDEEILEFYQSLSSDDILNEIKQMTVGNISSRAQAIEAVEKIKEQIVNNFIENIDSFIQLDENSVGADYDPDYMEGPSFPMFNLNANRSALDLYEATWGRILFNYEGNEVLRDSGLYDPNDLLEAIAYGSLPSELRGKSILDATTILNDNMVFGSAGLPLNLITKRAGRLSTDEETGIGILSGTTSIAYTEDMAEGYLHGDRYMIEIYAPTGTKGFNFDGRPEYTLPANTAYIELERSINEFGEKTAKILLLTEEQMAAIGLSRKNAEGNYVVDVEKSIFNQLFNPKNVNPDYDINQPQQADWLRYINEVTRSITDEGRFDREFMEFLDSTLPEIIESSLRQGFIESKDVFNIINELVPDIQSYEQMMTFFAYGTQNLVDDGGRFYEIETWANILDAAYNDMYNENYARKELKRQEREQEELINERIRASNERYDAQNPMFSSMNDYYDYISNNKYGRARHNIQNRSDVYGRDFLLKGIDFAERSDYRIHTSMNTVFNKILDTISYQDNGSNVYKKGFGFLKDKEASLIGFNNALEELSNIFPILTPAVIGLNTSLSALQTTIEVMENLSKFQDGKKTGSFILNTIQEWSNDSELEGTIKGQVGQVGKNIIGKFSETATKYLEMPITELLATLGPLLIVVAAIAAVIGGLYFWEKKHAEALAKSQKALEEATAKNNIAVSQYKDLKNARENETDAIKRQQAARREAVALYELESARIRRQNAIREEAKLRNDKVWGEYGIRAEYQKMDWIQAYFSGGGVGVIAKMLSGEFESQSEKYDGVTSNIRQVREDALGNLFATSEQRYVASIYDNNSMFFAEMEANSSSLQELYDKESRLIEKYGSIELARSSKEFKEAVQDFANATGLNGETAGLMLDYLEAENKVSQGMMVANARIASINAKYDAERMKIMYGDSETGLMDIDNLQDAMLLAEIQQAINNTTEPLWWDTLFKQLEVIYYVLTLQWHKASQTNKLIESNKNQINELDSSVVGIYGEAKDAADKADRKNYGNGSLVYGDTPFGGALDSAATMYGEDSRKYRTKSTYTSSGGNQAYQLGYLNNSNIENDISKIRKKGDTVGIQKEMLYYQRKISNNIEDIRRDNEGDPTERAVRLGAHAAGQILSGGRIPGVKGAAKKGTQAAGHFLNPEEVEMPGKTVLEKLGISGSKNAKIAGKGEGEVIEMVAKDGKYVAKGGKYAAKEGAEATGKAFGKTLGKTLGKIAPVIGPAVTAAFSIAEHNPFEKHYNEDGSEKRALQSTGEVVGEVGGSVIAMGLGLAATAAGGPIAGAIVEMGASLILEPLGKAIGGFAGWLGDELINGCASALSGVWDAVTGTLGSVWDGVSGAATGVWDWIVGGVTGGVNNVVNWLTGNNENTDIYSNVSTNTQQEGLPPNHNNNTTVIIKNININTEDNPEKIKSAIMNLIIEMQEQVSPRTVSRTIGKAPTQSTSTTQNDNNIPQAEGTDANSGEPNGDSNSITTNNNNPTI